MDSGRGIRVMPPLLIPKRPGRGTNIYFAPPNEVQSLLFQHHLLTNLFWKANTCLNSQTLIARAILVWTLTCVIPCSDLLPIGPTEKLQSRQQIYGELLSLFFLSICLYVLNVFFNVSWSQRKTNVCFWFIPLHVFSSGKLEGAFEIRTNKIETYCQLSAFQDYRNSILLDNRSRNKKWVNDASYANIRLWRNNGSLDLDVTSRVFSNIFRGTYIFIAIFSFFVQNLSSALASFPLVYLLWTFQMTPPDQLEHGWWVDGSFRFRIKKHKFLAWLVKRHKIVLRGCFIHEKRVYLLQCWKPCTLHVHVGNMI